MITCSFLLDGAEEEFICSFVYAANEVSERKELWADLKNHRDSPMMRGKPWLVVGDFNEILDIEEHSNYVSSPTVPLGMRDFQSTVNYCSLEDMSFQGKKYTWCNKRSSGLVCKKLDRVLMNDIWMNNYSQSYSVFEAGGCSDHLRCRFNLKPAALKPRKPFKFTNIIAEMPEFVPMVEEFWNNTETIFKSTSALFRLSKKLKSLNW